MTQDRRMNDRLPTEPLAWDTDRALTDAALRHLQDEKAAACLVEIPDTVPQLHVAIGTKAAIRGLLSDDPVTDTEPLAGQEWRAPAVPSPPLTEGLTQADELSDEERAALDRLDKPEWRASSHLRLRAILAVEVANCIRMGAKIENLQDELRATDGYRRGYTDGTADAARIADLQNDWRSIWDEGPLQGEAVLATNGTTVIAARWFAPGWAKHDHFSDEMEYLSEGWVTHWKPFPAAPTTNTTAQGEE